MPQTETKERIEFARKCVQRYREDIAEWQAKHTAVHECWLCEDLISDANHLFGRINDLDVWLHETVFRQPDSYNAQADTLLTDLYRGWLEISRTLLPFAEEMGRDYKTVSGLETFRRNVSEAEGILTDDATFFAGENLDRLEQQALAEHQAGRTEPWTIP
jgi:hypothetical protein